MKCIKQRNPEKIRCLLFVSNFTDRGSSRFESILSAISTCRSVFSEFEQKRWQKIIIINRSQGYWLLMEAGQFFYLAMQTEVQDKAQNSIAVEDASDLKKLTDKDYEAELERNTPMSEIQIKDEEPFYRLNHPFSAGELATMMEENNSFNQQNESFCNNQRDDQIQNKPVDRAKMRRHAKKNSLQFFAYLIFRFFQNFHAQLSQEEFNLLQKLKKSPTICSFNALFQQKGFVRKHLCEFFSPTSLWKEILSSKVRNYHYKLVYKEVADILRMGFIRSQLRRLSFSSE